MKETTRTAAAAPHWPRVIACDARRNVWHFVCRCCGASLVLRYVHGHAIRTWTAKRCEAAP